MIMHHSVIINWLIKTGALSAEDRELYEYALISTIMLVSPLLLSVAISAIMGSPVNGLILVIPFMTIRKYSGGYHSKRLASCIIEATILLTVMIYISKTMCINIYSYLILIIASIELCIASPIKSDNKDINNAEKRVYKKVVLIQVIIYIFIAVLLGLFHVERGALCIICGVVLTSILQIPCIITKKKQ